MQTLFSIWFNAREVWQSLQRRADAGEQRDAENHLLGAMTLAELESRERGWLQSH
jgi:hypothetical protein